MRTSTQTRTTRETDITVNLNLGGGGINISTGIGFFDHMLTSFATHGKFGLELTCKGDLHIDAHHTVEDDGIVLGAAFAAALGDKAGIVRFGSAFVPMDEALAFACADISGRPFLAFEGGGLAAMSNPGLESALVVEFMRAFAFNAGITLHLSVPYGRDCHDMTEAMFKALGRALRRACALESDAVVSTKGVL